MKLFDLHCDTLVECLRTGQSLWKNSCQLDVSRGLRYSPWIQCFAVWISDEARGAEATGIFDRAFSLLQRELQSRPEMKLVTSGKDLQARPVRGSSHRGERGRGGGQPGTASPPVPLRRAHDDPYLERRKRDRRGNPFRPPKRPYRLRQSRRGGNRAAFYGY